MRRLAPFLALLGSSACSLESDQTANECGLALRPPTIATVSRIPPRDVLLRDARSDKPEETGVIAHQLWGDKDKFPPIVEILEARGFRTTVEPEEYGWHLRIEEPVEGFRQHAKQRVDQLCKLADDTNLRYNGWWIHAGQHTDYVMQY